MTAPEPNITFYDAIEAYCGSLSYEPGEIVTLHVSTRAERYDVVIERWGAERLPVWQTTDVVATFTPPPDDADSNGCRWPVSLEFQVDQTWPSGFYLVTLTARGSVDGRPIRRGRDVTHTGFVVRAGDRSRRKKALLVLATNTWNAYNTWGGVSLYTGGTRVAFGRPWSRGMLLRAPTERDDRKARPTRWGEDPDIDGLAFQRYRLSRGYAATIGSSGWYLYERRFVEWAEADGFEFDYAVSSDLDRDPSVVDGYDLLLSVGHDEYWSARQRNVVEAHVKAGGRFVSFSGNTMFWQVRIEPAGDGGDEPMAAGERRGLTMVCYKYTAHTDDPVVAAGEPERMTGMFADPVVGRPEASFLGGGSAWGLYNRFGRAVARGAGAFTVYRHDHWLLEGTALGYGDLLGATHGVVGYETLGCRIQLDEFHLPVRAGGDDTPEHMTIVAYSPSSNLARGEYPKSISAISDQGDLEFIAERIHGDLSERSLKLARHGTAIMAEIHPFGPDGGQVVTVGTTDWVFGLPDDSAVAQVTRNALRGRP
jgi:hypothetical protein